MAHWSEYSAVEFNAYCSQREEVLRFWAAVAWRARELWSLGGQPPVLSAQFRALADRAAWAATELDPAKKTKIIAQRFISKGVWVRWQEARAGLMSRTSALKELQHEHVIQRSTTREAVASAGSEAAVLKALRRSVACVVTAAEAKALSDAPGDGWDRYVARKVAVWDRLLSRDHDYVPSENHFSSAELSRGA